MLNYKASNIAKAERKYDANFFKALSSLDPNNTRMADLLFILEAGGLDEDAASDLVDNEGLLEAINKAIAGLVEAGFLAKTPEIQEAKKSLKEASATTGEETKASPSK